jgi:hypothetical protein
MKEVYFMENKKYEYFWETHYPFAMYLKKIFPNEYKRKYSLEGNGIYNLLYIGKNIYEIKYTETKNMATGNAKVATDANKQMIIDTIVNNFNNGTKYSITDGKFITFPIAQFFAKLEIIKKMREPS